MVAALVEEAEKLVKEGFDARLAAADKGAAKEAEADRMALLDTQGADANQSEARVELISRRLAGGPAGEALGAGSGRRRARRLVLRPSKWAPPTRRCWRPCAIKSRSSYPGPPASRSLAGASWWSSMSSPTHSTGPPARST